MLIRAIASVAVAHTAAAQSAMDCATWQSTGSYPGTGPADGSSQVYSLVQWDPDGDGAMPALLVFGGAFRVSGSTQIERVGTWDGERVQPLGSPYLSGWIYSLCTWDEDGDGPGAPVLVAGGLYPNLSKFNGSTWEPIGAPLELGDVHALTSWDRDGEGPAPPVLVVVGDFVSQGGIEINHVAIWNGTNWEAAGTGLGGSFVRARAVTTHDPDGSGPLPSNLIVGGDFTLAGGVTVRNVARWDGSQWSALGQAAQDVNSLLAWDDDSDPATPDSLFAGGADVFRWDGTEWLALQSPIGYSPCEALTSWDPDGPGPLQEVLCAAGGLRSTAPSDATQVLYASGLHAWDGCSWQQIGRVPRGNTYEEAPVLALGTWDPDGNGPAQPRLFSAGEFTSINDRLVRNIAEFDGDSWRSLGSGAHEPVRAIVSYPEGVSSALHELDADHDGSRSAEFVIQERRITSSLVFSQVTSRSTAGWRRMGGLYGVVNAMVMWDPDAGGDAAARVVVAGTFDQFGQPPIPRIAMFEEVSGWMALGPDLNNTVSGLVTMPAPDSPGSVWLIAGGAFTAVGSMPLRALASHNGYEWRPFETPITPDSTGASKVDALVLWDDDGDPVTPRALVAAGQFGIPGVASARLASWSAGQWAAIPPPNAAVSVMCEWDPDGLGPQPPLLVVGGPFTLAGDVPANSVAWWDGTRWGAFSSGLTDFAFDNPFMLPRVGGLVSWDPDGSGPLTPQLVAGGRFRRAGGAPTSFIARWDGTAWYPLGSGTSDPVYALAVKKPLPTDPPYDQIMVGGTFETAGGLYSRFLAVYGCALPSVPTCPGDVTGDARVDLADVGSLILIWDTNVPSGHPSDLDADGHIGLGDLASVIQNWASVCSN